MMTNWPDVFALLISGLTFCGGLGIGAWLVVTGHPGFAFFVFLIMATFRMTTGH